MPDRTPKLLFGLTLAIIIGWLLILLKFVFLPLILAVFLAFLLNPLVGWLTRHKMPQFLAALLAMVLTLLVVYLTGTIILKSLVSFQTEFPRYEKKFQTMLATAEKLANLDIGPVTNERLRQEVGRFSLSSAAGYLLNSVFSFLSYLLFTFVFVIYFLMGSPKLPGKINRAFSPDKARNVNNAINSISRQVQRYIWAKTFTSLITGASMMVICLIFGIDFFITWGFFMFLLNFIPTFGPLVGGVPPLIVLLIDTGSWVTLVWAMLAMLTVFLALGNYIEPKILGDSVNLSPLVALFSLIFWGWLWGPAGMLVAVPVTALFKFTFDNIESLQPLGVLMGGK